MIHTIFWNSSRVSQKVNTFFSLMTTDLIMLEGHISELCFSSLKSWCRHFKQLASGHSLDVSFSKESPNISLSTADISLAPKKIESVVPDSYYWDLWGVLLLWMIKDLRWLLLRRASKDIMNMLLDLNTDWHYI